MLLVWNKIIVDNQLISQWYYANKDIYFNISIKMIEIINKQNKFKTYALSYQ